MEISIANIINGLSTPNSTEDYVEVNVIAANIPNRKKDDLIVCYFIFGDRDNHITGKLFINNKDDSLAWNVYNTLNELKNSNSVCRIKNFKLEDNTFTMIRSITKSIKLSRSTLDIEFLDTSTPNNFLQHIPFEFTKLKKDLDNVPDGNLVDIIGIVNEVKVKKRSQCKGYDGRVVTKEKSTTVQLNSSRLHDGISRKLTLFGGYADLKFKKNTVYAVLNAKVKTFQNHKFLETDKSKTVILEIPRDKLENLLPMHYTEEFVKILFPKSRQSLKRKLDDLPTNEITDDYILALVDMDETNKQNVPENPKPGTSREMQGTEIFCDPEPLEIYDPEMPEIVATHDSELPEICDPETLEIVEINDSETPETSVNNENCDPGENGMYYFNYMKPLDVVVRKGEVYKDDDTNTCYNMRSKPRGLALIIDNRYFPHMKKNPTRCGSECDNKNLTCFFQQCDIQVETYVDVKSTELPDIISDFKKKFEEVHVDACFVIVLSHGTDRCVEMVDGKLINVYQNIIYQFSEQSGFFPVMKGKPKVFIIQTCQHEGQDECSKGLQPKPNQPKGMSNIIVCRPNIPGYSAYRDTVVGTHFIYTLVNIMMKKSYNTDFLTMLQEVRDELEKVNVHYKGNNFSESSWEALFGFRKQLFFNPGM